VDKNLYHILSFNPGLPIHSSMAFLAYGLVSMYNFTAAALSDFES